MNSPTLKTTVLLPYTLGLAHVTLGPRPCDNSRVTEKVAGLGTRQSSPHCLNHISRELTYSFYSAQTSPGPRPEAVNLYPTLLGYPLTGSARFLQPSYNQHKSLLQDNTMANHLNQSAIPSGNHRDTPLLSYRKSTLPKSAKTIHVGMHFHKNKGNKQSFTDYLHITA